MWRVTESKLMKSYSSSSLHILIIKTESSCCHWKGKLLEFGRLDWQKLLISLRPTVTFGQNSILFESRLDDVQIPAPFKAGTWQCWHQYKDPHSICNSNLIISTDPWFATGCSLKLWSGEYVCIVLDEKYPGLMMLISIHFRFAANSFEFWIYMLYLYKL